MAASSSTIFFGLSEEELRQSHMNQQQNSGGPSSDVQAPTAPAAPPQRRRRNQPGTPSPDAEVIALSPTTLMATNRFLCEVCHKGFQREQNLQLHRRGHNLPWKLRQKTTKEVKRKVYLCPEPTCVHHDPSRALGDLTGIKKHFSRKHGEKKFRCDKCSKKYAVQSDWKAHTKTCGTREYKCDCGTLFSRRDSFVTHRAFCDALAQETAKQTPPSLSSIGTHLFGRSSSVVSLGSSSQLLNPQIAQDDILTQPSTAILGLGGGARTFGSLLGQSIGSAFRPIHALTASAPLFFSAAEPEFQEDSKQLIHGINTSYGGSLFGGLSFLSGGGGGIDGGNNNYSGRLYGHANVTAGDHNSSNIFSAANDTPLYSTSVQMSATALLQKAAQLGSTSSIGSASLLNSFVSSSSGGGTKSCNFGGIFGGLTSGGTNFNDLIYSLTAGGRSSIFGSGGLENGERYEGYNGKSVMSLEEPPSHHGLGFGKVDGTGAAAGPDRSVLTRDFLGMGQIVRSVSGGLEQERQRQQQQQIEMGFLMDSEEKAAAKLQLPFGGGGNVQG